MQVYNEEKTWDVFISHASEDKKGFVRKLANALRYLEIKVWYDEFTLKVGMSLTQSIDIGLSKSNFGIIVFSKHFLSKKWTEYEKRSLIIGEIHGKQSILPIWYKVSQDEILEYSHFFADKVALNTSTDSFDTIVLKLLEVIRPDIYSNYSRYLTYLKLRKSGEIREADVMQIKTAEIRHNNLPQTLINRIKNTHFTVGRYFGGTVDDSIDAFKRDLFPEEEIKVWEVIAATFSEFISDYNITEKSLEKEIAYTLLLISLGIPPKTKLESSELAELKKRWYANLHR